MSEREQFDKWWSEIGKPKGAIVTKATAWMAWEARAARGLASLAPVPAAPQGYEPRFVAPLYCPKCGTRHVDEGEWATRPHHKHLCASCGFLWRVEPYTFGAQPSAAREDTADAAWRRLIQNRPRLESSIAAGILNCVEAHGPITKEWTGSAAKRVIAVIKDAIRALPAHPAPSVAARPASEDKE